MKRLLFFFFLFLVSCQFHTLYNEEITKGICVSPIPEAAGYQLQQLLQQRFPDKSNCNYTLQVEKPAFSVSDQGISNKDFITIEQIHGSVSYTLLDTKKKAVLKKTVSAVGSSSIVANPYSSNVASEKTRSDLIPILAEQISLHIAAYLDRNQK